MKPQFHWNARQYFRALTARNNLARQLGLVCCDVSGLQGFEDVLTNLLNAPGFIALADSSDGLANIDNTPNVRRVKTVFLGLRHAADGPDARNLALDRLRELFRQILSHILRERNRLHTQGIYLDPEITFTEIDSYFATGTACAYFQIAYSTSFDLRYSKELWSDGDLWLFGARIPDPTMAQVTMLLGPFGLNAYQIRKQMIDGTFRPTLLHADYNLEDDTQDIITRYRDTFDLRILPYGQQPETEETPGPEKIQLWLISLGTATKTNVIKAVRSITGLGLADAKALVDNVPSLILADWHTSITDDPVAQLTALGAVIELR